VRWGRLAPAGRGSLYISAKPGPVQVRFLAGPECKNSRVRWETGPTPSEVRLETGPTPSEVRLETGPTPSEVRLETGPTPLEVRLETGPTPLAPLVSWRDVQTPGGGQPQPVAARCGQRALPLRRGQAGTAGSAFCGEPERRAPPSSGKAGWPQPAAARLVDRCETGHHCVPLRPAPSRQE
jgi:hypothetical protein